MGVGKRTRLNRIFGHPSGRFLSVAVDHFIAYGEGAHGIPAGIKQISRTLEALVAGKPDAITMHKGIATSAWEPLAGRVPLILQSSIVRPDDTVCEQIANAEDAIHLGADALAVAAFALSPNVSGTLFDSTCRLSFTSIPVSFLMAYRKSLTSRNSSPGRFAAGWNAARM